MAIAIKLQVIIRISLHCIILSYLPLVKTSNSILYPSGLRLIDSITVLLMIKYPDIGSQIRCVTPGKIKLVRVDAPQDMILLTKFHYLSSLPQYNG